MDISTEKRIADATAKEIAELNSLKDKGYVMVPLAELVRLITEAQNYQVIMKTYQHSSDISTVEPVLKGLAGYSFGVILRKITEQEIKDRKQLEEKMIRKPQNMEDKKDDAE